MSQVQSTADHNAAHPSGAAPSTGEAAYFWKGRVALYAILRALGIGPGDDVVTPGYTCVVVPTAVHFAGARPLFADIDPETYNISLASIEAVATPAVKAVVVQHTYGLPVDCGPVVRWAQSRGIWVIEDCCHAQGSRYRDLASASATWTLAGECGDAAFYSSQWQKPFTTGLGGWATAKDAEIRRRLQELSIRDFVEPGLVESATLAVQRGVYRAFYRPSLYWFAQDSLRMLARAGLLVGSSESGELDAQMPVGFAKRMSPTQRRAAERGRAQTESYVAQRRAIRQELESLLRTADVPLLATPDYADPALLRYPVRVRDKPHVLAEARRQHIELGDWFDHPLHPIGANVAALGWREGLCPVAERAAAEVINVPMHDRVTRSQLEQTVAFVRQFRV